MKDRLPRPDSFDSSAGTRAIAAGAGCALQQIASSVCVITTRSNDELLGITVSSTCVVSYRPPILAWCQAGTRPSLRAFIAADHFVVNVLTEGMADVARIYSEPAGERFARDSYFLADFALPVLAGCVSNLLCKRLSSTPIGDHFMHAGLVDHAITGTLCGPLLYLRRSFASVK